MKNLIKRQEFYILIAIVLLASIIGIKNDAFFSLRNIFSLGKSTVVMGIFAMGTLLVLLSGGIDVSMTAVAAFSMYITCKWMVESGYEGSVVLAFVISMGIGGVLGIINGLLVSIFNFPTMIVSLGTSYAFAGFIYTFVSTRIVNVLPKNMTGFSKSEIFTTTLANGQKTGLTVAFIIMLFVMLATFLLLRYTMLGRSIFAIGGSQSAAERAGINVRKVKLFIYPFVGVLAGLAGIIHSAFMRNSNPFDLIGTELNVIAAAVLGGANVGGGKGTVIGTFLGVVLMVIVDNSLVFLGIPTYSQRITTGIIILLATGIPAIIRRRSAAKAGQ